MLNILTVVLIHSKAQVRERHPWTRCRKHIYPTQHSSNYNFMDYEKEGTKSGNLGSLEVIRSPGKTFANHEVLKLSTEKSCFCAVREGDQGASPSWFEQERLLVPKNNIATIVTSERRVAIFCEQERFLINNIIR